MSSTVHCPSRVSKKSITVFTKTPAEHQEAYRWPSIYGPISTRWWASMVSTCSGKDVLPEWALPAPPAGHIRVKWYSLWERLDCKGGELEANVSLEPNGDLDLTKIQHMWGMDKCVAVNPWRMKRFEPTQEDTLTSLAIHCLKDDEGAIRIIEEPSERVKKIRNIRWSVIMFFRECRDVPYVIALLLILTLFALYWCLSSLKKGYDFPYFSLGFLL